MDNMESQVCPPRHETPKGESADPEALLPLALSQPPMAMTMARRVLSEGPPDRAASLAHQAICVVERGAGHMPEAIAHGRSALRRARHVDAERQGDVLATLGATLVYAGHTTEGLQRLEEALPLTPERTIGRVLHRRAHILGLLGRYRAALGDLDRAIQHSHRHGDTLWEGRSLVNRSDVHLALGELRRADEDARRADALLTSAGQDFEAVQARHNRALAAYHAGDLVAALTLLDEVADGYRALDLDPLDLVLDRGQMLLTAGLAAEARAALDATLAGSSLSPTKRAELLLMAARAALADDDPPVARALAEEADRLFRHQDRARWATRAQALSLQARYQMATADARPAGPAGPASPPESSDPRAKAGEDRKDAAAARRLLRDTGNLVVALRRQGSRELPEALLLHARTARWVGRPEEAAASLAEAAAARHTGPPLGRAVGWLAAAHLAAQRQDRRALLAACRRGLDAVDEHRATLGDRELRALATEHGLELAALAVEDAVRAGDARALLWWAERWRATALLGNSSARPDAPFGTRSGGRSDNPPGDRSDSPGDRSECPGDRSDSPGGRSDTARAATLERDIAALRDVAHRLEAAEEGSAAAQSLAHERSRREAAVRRAYRHVRGSGRTATGFDLRAASAALGDTVLLSLVNVGGTLHAVTMAKGRVSRRRLGSTEAALREAEFARFALRRHAYGRTGDLAGTAERLQASLLGTPLPAWSAGQVVLTPPPDLLTAPWGLLPAFADTALTVSPSATLWLQARHSLAAVGEGHVALVTGPGLRTQEQEVTALSPVHEGARVLAGSDATVAAALEVLDGAGLAHIAAHGSFRAEAPLFSSLSLSDGPLTVHDLDGLRHPPQSMILSACDSGVAAPIAAHEVLGLVTSLLELGTHGVLASIVPVNDRATLELMPHVHRVAAHGGSLADGWLAARRAAGDDPLLQATAAAFTAWGG